MIPIDSPRTKQKKESSFPFWDFPENDYLCTRKTDTYVRPEENRKNGSNIRRITEEVIRFFMHLRENGTDRKDH